MCKSTKSSNTFTFIVKSTLIYYIIFSSIALFINSDLNSLLFTEWESDIRILFIVSLVTYQILYLVSGDYHSLD